MPISARALRALDGLDRVAWSTLRHPYGAAVDVPEHLRGFLAPPDCDDALEAATFFGAYFVCQATHFDDAAPHAIPFMLRLLSAPGVSARGPLMAAVLEIVRISIDPTCAAVEPSLKRACLDALAHQSDAILAVAELLDGHGFDEAIDALVVACADTLTLVATSRAPTRVHEVLAHVHAAGMQGSARDRLAAWTLPRAIDPCAWLREIASSLPDEYSPSDGDDDDDDEPAAEVPVDREARCRAECSSATIPETLERDRAALTELFVTYRLQAEYDVSILLPGGAQLGLKAPAVCDGQVLSGSVALRIQITRTPADLPIDAWVERDHKGLWLAILLEKYAEFAGFCRSYAFLDHGAK